MATLIVYDGKELLREYYLPTVADAVQMADDMWEKHRSQTFVVLDHKNKRVYAR